MKEKFKSFFAAIGCMFLAVAINLVVSMVCGAILGLVYAVNTTGGAKWICRGLKISLLVI